MSELIETVNLQAGTSAAEMRRWLGSGVLQSPAGAFCAWRDGATGDLAFEYPEITGYALTWLAACEDLADCELDAGFKAADWLVDRFAAGDRSARAGWDNGAVYTFDLGMIAAGLQSFGELVDDVRYTDQGRAVARDLAAYVSSPCGLEAIAPDGPATDRPSSWSTLGRPHLLKCVQALLLAEQDDAAGRLARLAMSLQSEDGRFITQPDSGEVMLHPHLYTVEGLWMWGTAMDCDEAIERARLATAWAWEHQLVTGGLPRFVSETTVGPEQLDLTAQAIRAALLLDVEPRGLQKAIDRLGDLSIATPDGSALGYQPQSGTAHRNAWVTMFAAQALDLAGSRRSLAWHGLV
jgi:hypothetical protein